MTATVNSANFFGTEKISKILLKIAPPVMLSQLIQALYNIVDSFFVGQYSVHALTALSVIFPLQLVIIALAVGTGVGVNTYMARKYAQNDAQAANAAGGTGMVLEIVTWLVFAAGTFLLLPTFVATSAQEPEAIADAICYGNIVCIGSIGMFLESNWSKIHQAQGNMRLPMVAQIIGAVLNIALDPLLIFGYGMIPAMGAAGAAYATVAGQTAAAVITGIKGWRRPPAVKQILYYAKRIYAYGYPAIAMQALCTVYIVALNIILAGFSDAAVTVLGLYYKLQSFVFIPLLALETCIVPVLSYNYTRRSYERCQAVMNATFGISAAFMVIGMVGFIFFPRELVGLFSDSAQVLTIGSSAFPIIGASFMSAIFSLMLPVFFQAIGNGRASLLLALTRQIFCLLPSFWLFSLIGLQYTWLAFPVSETLAGAVGLLLYRRVLQEWRSLENYK